MTQLILKVEDNSLLPSLRKILSSMIGVTIEEERPLDVTASGGTLIKAIEDVKAGRVTRVNSVSELMEELEK